MLHPFVDIDQLKSKSADELQKTITDLYSKLTFAYRTQNSTLSNQIQMVIESYNTVYKSKIDEMMDKRNLNSHINVEKK